MPKVNVALRSKVHAWMTKMAVEMVNSARQRG